MINTLLVLVSLLVYTFDVSKTTFEDKDIVLMSFRARNTCRRDRYWRARLSGPAHAWCDHTTAHPNPKSNKWRNFL